MNSEGGLLILGVSDDGRVVGVEREYPYADPKKQDRDGYELMLRNSLTQKLGVKALPYFSLHFGEIRHKEICYIRVRPAPHPVYLDGDLVIKSGNQKRHLKAEEAIDYIRQHWPSQV